jgi:dienelactone hydrolase
MHPDPSLSRGWTAVLLLIALNTSVLAQDIRDALRKNTQGQKPVSVQAEVKDSIDAHTRLSNYTFKPPGEGPFSAVVLMHTCGGIENPHMRVHARELLENGYVVLMLDSYGPRGISNCKANPIASSVGAMDAYAALDFLTKQSFVDKSRIYQAGYSWGAVTATLLASPQSAEVLGSVARFRGTVSHYSTCVFGGKYPAVTRDADRPLLMLLGERDQELPPSSCFPLLDEMKTAGAPVQWHVYPGATHGWDKQGEGRNGYVYDEATAKDATRRMLEFFAQNR